MKKLNLLLAILLAILTTIGILLFFYKRQESNLGWAIVMLFSIIGYCGSYIYYENYKDIG